MGISTLERYVHTSPRNILIPHLLDPTPMATSSKYEQIEKDRYEQSWSALQGKFGTKSGHYTTAIPTPSAIEFVRFLQTKLTCGTILDLGCGNARHTILFAKAGYESYGIDVASAALELAKKNAAINHVRLHLNQSSVLSIPLHNQQFDIVFDSGCLHHLRKSEWILYKNNLLTILKPSGYYYLLCFSNNSSYIPHFTPKTKNRTWTNRHGHYSHFASNEEITRFFKEFTLLYHSESNRDGSSKLIQLHTFYFQRKL